jgi:hypothetical protein
MLILRKIESGQAVTFYLVETLGTVFMPLTAKRIYTVMPIIAYCYNN